MREATGIAKAPYVAEFVKLCSRRRRRSSCSAGTAPSTTSGTTCSPTTAGHVHRIGVPEAEGRGAGRVRARRLPGADHVPPLRRGRRRAAARIAHRVFGELDWSPQVHEQAIGRLRRDGMADEPPVAYFLNSTEGSDPAIMETLAVSGTRRNRCCRRRQAVPEQRAGRVPGAHAREPRPRPRVHEGRRMSRGSRPDARRPDGRLRARRAPLRVLRPPRP